MTEISSSASASLLLLGCAHGALERQARRDGWQVEAATIDALDHAASRADLIVVDAATRAGVQAVARLRRLPHPIAAVPVVGLSAPAEPCDVDGHLPPRDDPAAIAALLDRWRPDPPDTLQRIEAAFGADAVRDLLVRLQAQLIAAHADPRGAAVAAHRLCGVAGMLGFAALGRCWQEVEAGVPDAIVAARIETRRALAAIARRLAA